MPPGRSSTRRMIKRIVSMAQGLPRLREFQQNSSAGGSGAQARRAPAWGALLTTRRVCGAQREEPRRRRAAMPPPMSARPASASTQVSEPVNGSWPWPSGVDDSPALDVPVSPATSPDGLVAPELGAWATVSPLTEPGDVVVPFDVGAVGEVGAVVGA